MRYITSFDILCLHWSYLPIGQSFATSLQTAVLEGIFIYNSPGRRGNAYSGCTKSKAPKALAKCLFGWQRVPWPVQWIQPLTSQHWRWSGFVQIKASCFRFKRTSRARLFTEFIPDKDEAQMRQDVDLSHLDSDLQENINSLIRKFWSDFDSKGIFCPC